MLTMPINQISCDKELSPHRFICSNGGGLNGTGTSKFLGVINLADFTSRLNPFLLKLLKAFNFIPVMHYYLISSINYNNLQTRSLDSSVS